MIYRDSMLSQSVLPQALVAREYFLETGDLASEAEAPLRKMLNSQKK